MPGEVDSLPQVLQPPNSISSTTDQFQGALARTSPFEDLNEDHSESYSEALEREASELSESLSTPMEIEDFDSDGQAEDYLLANEIFPVNKQQAWSEAEQPQMCPSFLDVSQMEPQETSSLKKPSITSNLCPKTLPLFTSEKESPMSPQEDASSEVTTSQSKGGIQSPLCIADGLLTESPSICDTSSEMQLSCSRPPSVLPPAVLNLQPSNTGLLQVHVSAANSSQLHLTVSSPSQQSLPNSDLSHIPVTCLPASQSPLESFSLQSGLEGHKSLIPLPGDTPSLLNTESDSSSNTLARLNVLIQPSLIKTDLLQCEVADMTEQQAQGQTMSAAKFSDASSVRSPTRSQKSLKMPAGVSKTLKSAPAYSTKTVPVNSIMVKAPTPILNSTSASPLSMSSSAPTSAGVLSPADSQTLKSPSAKTTVGKLPVAKPSVKKISSASASAHRLRTSSPSKQQSSQTSPSKQKASEVSLLLKPPTTSLSLLDPSMVNSEISAFKQTLKYSKLRPPSIFVTAKQTDSPERSSTLMQQDNKKSPLKGTASNLPRVVTQKKDLHAGDGTNPSRLSRLPKPKTQ